MSDSLLFGHFSPSFFIPFVGNTAAHAERVVKRIFENYSRNGIFSYRKDDLKRLIVNETRENSNNYTVDGLMTAMENGGWFEVKLSAVTLINDYIINDSLFDFCEAMHNIRTKEKDVDSLNDVRAILSNLIENSSIDSISTMELMIKEDQSRLRRIIKKIERKIKEITQSPSTIEALRECESEEFKEIFQKDIAAAFSLKTDVGPFVSKIDRILDSQYDEEYENVIENIAKNAGDRNFGDMTPVEYVREELNKIRDSLVESEQLRTQVTDNLFKISIEAIRRLDILMSFRSMDTELDYDLIFYNLDKHEGNTGEVEISTPYVRTQAINTNEPARIKIAKKEKVKGERISKSGSSEKRKSDYDKAKNIDNDIVKKVIEEQKYKKLSEIPIDNIYGIMLFMTAEKYARENNNQVVGIVQTESFEFEDRML